MSGSGLPTRHRGDEAERMIRHRSARLLLRHAESGVLSTHSFLHPGYPYGSALPCATDARGRLLILISHLAEHTKNIVADGRVSFLVSPTGAQLQQQARVTVLGDAQLLTHARERHRYLMLHPDAESHLAVGGFNFYRIEPLQARYIAGFGSMNWLDCVDLLAPPSALDDAEEDIVAHMNVDHGPALQDYCRHVYKIRPRSAIMCAIDCDGFNVHADGRLLRFDFTDAIDSPQQAREQLVRLAQECRP